MTEGLHSHRLKSNPMEKRFAECWDERQVYGRTLEYILSVDNIPRPVNEHDEQVAATVIQWLGSPVGLSFLEKVLQLEIPK